MYTPNYYCPPTDAPKISQAPVLMLRPRAWNMVEHNMMVLSSNFNTLMSKFISIPHFTCIQRLDWLKV